MKNEKGEKMQKFQLKTYTLVKRSDVRLIEDWKLIADKYTTMENGDKTEFDSVEGVKQFATNLIAEILKRNTITFHPENIQPASMELLRHSLQSLIKSGIYLTEPHAGLIYEEKKSAIVKSREFQKLLDFNILVSKEKAYGFIRFKKPKELSLKQFNGLKDKHRISEAEAFKWWPKLQQKGQGFIYYEVRDFIPYGESLLIKQVTGAQVFVDDVQFKDVVSKPYPREHACRLRNPDDFKEGSFRRMEREHDGKRYSVIMGRLKGETTLTEQAYRYNKEKWTAGEGKVHCSEHDGTFEAAVEEEKTAKDIISKGAIHYKKTPLATEGIDWDADKEVKAAEVEDLKVMCAWVGDEPENKTAYKLPHHKASGEHACVWRAVATCAAILMGARGGIDIPAGDVAGVKAHIARHYKDFDKGDAPWQREKTEKQLTGDDAEALIPPEQATDMCVCPECDTKVPKTDKPCKEVECLQCGHSMKAISALGKIWEVPILKAGEQRFVYGIVLQPDIEDGQGDVVSKEEIAKTAHQFMENCQRIGVQHNIIVPQIKIWESYITPEDMRIAGQEVKKGSWILGVHITDDSIWKQVKSGELTGFSIKGFASTREE